MQFRLGLFVIIVNVIVVLWRRMSKVSKQFLRFVIVGIINTVIYYICYRLFLNEVEYIYAHIGAFLFSAFCSYFLTTFFTFKTKPSISTFIRFPLTFLPNFVLSTFGTEILISNGIIDEKYASLFMMLVIIPLTFIINKIIFRGKK